jgi:hypothetical protein
MRRNSFPNRGSSSSQRRDNPPPPEQEPVPTAVKVLGAAAIFGAIVGLGSVSIGKGGPERIASSANDLPAKADAPISAHFKPVNELNRWITACLPKQANPMPAHFRSVNRLNHRTIACLSKQAYCVPAPAGR